MKYCHLYYRIPFSETDAMGIVHHSNHARYLERGRIEFLRLIGQGYSSIMKQGIHFPVLELKIGFKKPMYFDEVILVETWVSQLTKTRLGFEYRVYSAADMGTNALVRDPFPAIVKATGATSHCGVNDKGRPIEMSDILFEQLSAYLGAS